MLLLLVDNTVSTKTKIKTADTSRIPYVLLSLLFNFSLFFSPRYYLQRGQRQMKSPLGPGHAQKDIALLCASSLQQLQRVNICCGEGVPLFQ